MKFGHHGANHPVMDLATSKIEITSQNHSFAVDMDSLDPKKARVSHKNLNDGTVEGLELLQSPAFTVQYHPEAAPGPRESQYLFDRFRVLIEKHAAGALVR
jgi:carbamoyl-phosphate synthase small subunit